MTNLDPKWGEVDAMHDPYALANFQVRPTDVLITTAAKAGTTWMQQILHQLRTGGDTSFESIDDVVPWLELPRDGKTWQQVLEEYEARENPRLFKTHCTYPQTPGTDVAKIILTLRDPRDCCVSMYHHQMNIIDEARAKTGMKAPESFAIYFEEWIEAEGWYRNVKSWWPHKDKQNILMLRFVDLKENFEIAIDDILRFLNWTISIEDKKQVLEFCSFTWMKAHSEKFANQNSQRTQIFKKDSFIRKGKVGDFKKLMSSAQEQRVLDKARDQFEPACVEYLSL